MAKKEEKKVDEDWKAEVQAEKEAGAGKSAAEDGEPKPKGPEGKEPEKEKATPGPETLPPPDFGLFVQSLVIEGLVYLGATPNPATGKTETNLPQAKYIIGLLETFEEKTRGNLTQGEERLLKGALTDLRMRYVKQSS